MDRRMRKRIHEFVLARKHSPPRGSAHESMSHCTVYYDIRAWSLARGRHARVRGQIASYTADKIWSSAKYTELHRGCTGYPFIVIRAEEEHTPPIQGDASSALQRSCPFPPLSTTPCSTKELNWFPPTGIGESFCFPSSTTPKTRFKNFSPSDVCQVNALTL